MSSPRSVTFAANDTEQTVTLVAVDDGVDDDGETVDLTLANMLPGGVSAGSPASATVTLADNDTVTGAPTIQSVSLISYPRLDGRVGYQARTPVFATVRFDREVTVTGNPQLGLTVGSVTRQARYRGGEREVLRFRYSVAAGEVDADGISIPANALTLNGGTIRASANQDAVLVHGPVADDPDHRVDGVSPTLLEAEVDGAEVRLRYDEPLRPPRVPEEARIALALGTLPFGFVAADNRRIRAERVRVHGQMARVTMSERVLKGETLTVRYSSGGRWAIQDRAGNRAPRFSREATNVTKEAAVYDTDGDGLIEITTLAQLDAIRQDLDGDGAASTPAGGQVYRAAFPEAFREEVGGGRLVCANQCRGYELFADLDFDTDGDGAVDSDDDYWNDGAGWDPIGPSFEATFEGNGHVIRHLFIDRPARFFGTGLFRKTRFSSIIRGVGLIDVEVTGSREVGGLVGSGSGDIEASYTTGHVSGVKDVGGLAGWFGAGTSSIHASYSTCSVSGNQNVGGLIGYDFGAAVFASYATGKIAGQQGVGGLVGALVPTSSHRIRASYATGRVTGDSDVGGLVGVDGTQRFSK